MLLQATRKLLIFGLQKPVQLQVLPEYLNVELFKNLSLLPLQGIELILKLAIVEQHNGQAFFELLPPEGLLAKLCPELVVFPFELIDLVKNLPYFHNIFYLRVGVFYNLSQALLDLRRQLQDAADESLTLLAVHGYE